MNIKAQSSGILYLIAIILIFSALIAGVYYIGNGRLGSVAPLSTGITLLGLSNVGVLSNYGGFAGPWWVATAVLGGGETLNVQGLGGASAPASVFAQANSSYVCGSSCQQNNVQISTISSYLEYPIEGSGTPVVVYNITYLGFGKDTLTYNTCINGPLVGTSNLPSANSSTGETVNFGGCANTAAQQQAYLNYFNVCKNSKGTPLTTQAGTLLFDINFGGIGIPIYSGSTVGCYELNSIPYATVFGLDSAIPQYTVAVTVNGQTVTLNNQYAYNTTNPNILLFNIGNGFNSETAPSETTVSTVRYVKNSTQLLEGNSGTGIASEVSVLMNTVQRQFSSAQSLSNATNYVSIGNSNIGAALVNSYVNTQFKNATIAATKTGAAYVMLNDPKMLYTRPNIQMAFKASYVGLYLGVASFNITSVEIPAFRSGSESNAYVQIENTGTAQGGYSLLPSSQSGVIVIPSSQSGTLSPGSQQTITFTLNDNDAIESNTSQSVSFTLCNLANQCQTVTRSFTLVPSCNSNQEYNVGTCQTLTIITAPTTSIIGGNGSVTTTVLPCDPQTGQNCPVTPVSGLPNWIYVVIVILIIAVIAAIVYAYAKRGG